MRSSLANSKARSAKIRSAGGGCLLCGNILNSYYLLYFFVDIIDRKVWVQHDGIEDAIAPIDCSN